MFNIHLFLSVIKYLSRNCIKVFKYFFVSNTILNSTLKFLMAYYLF